MFWHVRAVSETARRRQLAAGTREAEVKNRLRGLNGGTSIPASTHVVSILYIPQSRFLRRGHI